jgi:hypothetical protein
MTYQVTYRADAWVRAETGAPEWRQVVSVDLDDGTHLVVVVVVCGAMGSPPRVAAARIEQAYRTRTEGWKRRTVKRLRPQEVELVGETGEALCL